MAKETFPIGPSQHNIAVDNFNLCGVEFESVLSNYYPWSTDVTSMRDVVQQQTQLMVKKRQKLSIVILDWDDTLYPTSWLTRNYKDITIKQLQEFGNCLHKLLTQWITIYGEKNLYIITNATKSWPLESIKWCNDMYLYKTRKNKEKNRPKLACFDEISKILKSDQIRIVSARDLYIKHYPNRQEAEKWKTETFKTKIFYHFRHIKGPSNDNNIFQIISIGDSTNEFNAALKAKDYFAKYIQRRNSKRNIVRLHRIKLKKYPTISELTQQMMGLTEEAIILYFECGSTTMEYK